MKQWCKLLGFITFSSPQVEMTESCTNELKDFTTLDSNSKFEIILRAIRVELGMNTENNFN